MNVLNRFKVVEKRKFIMGDFLNLLSITLSSGFFWDKGIHTLETFLYRIVKSEYFYPKFLPPLSLLLFKISSLSKF